MTQKEFENRDYKILVHKPKGDEIGFNFMIDDRCPDLLELEIGDMEAIAVMINAIGEKLFDLMEANDVVNSELKRINRDNHVK